MRVTTTDNAKDVSEMERFTAEAYVENIVKIYAAKIETAPDSEKPAIAVQALKDAVYDIKGILKQVYREHGYELDDCAKEE